MRSKMLAVLVATVLLITYSWAATEQVLFNFTGGNDGGYSHSALTYRAGSFYGVTAGGGTFNSGVVFKLTPTPTGWVETVLYTFTGGRDGGGPFSDVIFDNGWNIYGTTSFGGANGVGVVYELLPSGPGYTQRVLHTFTNGNDGGIPFQDGKLLFDSSGNLYGTTNTGGAFGFGTVFELKPSSNRWIEIVLYSFTGGTDGANPIGGVIAKGPNLYGAVPGGGTFGNGVVFELQRSASG